MPARTVRTQRRVLVASLAAAMVMPMVGSDLAYGLPTETGRLSADAEQAMSGMRGAYTVRGLRAAASTTATFQVPEFDVADCGTTGDAWVERRVYRPTRDGDFYVQVWTTCGDGRVRSGAWWRGGTGEGVPPMYPGDRVTVTTEGSRHETRLSLHNLDRGWVAEMTSPSAPAGSYTVFMNHVWDWYRDWPFLERASFKRLRIDGRAFGEYSPKRFEGECSRVSPIRRGTSFRVTYECAP